MEREMKIFLVEDDEALADEVRQFLEKWGYEAVKADSFEDIVSDFQRLSPHLVLLDINLLFLTGFTGAPRFGKFRTSRFYLSAVKMMIWIKLWRSRRAGTTMWKSRLGLRF